MYALHTDPAPGATESSLRYQIRIQEVWDRLQALRAVIEKKSKKKEKQEDDYDDDDNYTDNSGSDQSTLIGDDDSPDCPSGADPGEEVMYEEAAIIPRSLLPADNHTESSDKENRRPIKSGKFTDSIEEKPAGSDTVACSHAHSIADTGIDMDALAGSSQRKANVFRDPLLHRSKPILQSENQMRSEEEMIEIRKRVLTFDPNVLITQEEEFQNNPITFAPSPKPNGFKSSLFYLFRSKATNKDTGTSDDEKCVGMRVIEGGAKKKRKNHRSKKKPSKAEQVVELTPEEKVFRQGLAEEHLSLIKRFDSGEYNMRELMARLNFVDLEIHWLWLQKTSVKRGYYRTDFMDPVFMQLSEQNAEFAVEYDKLLKRKGVKVEREFVITSEPRTKENEEPINTSTVSMGIPGTNSYREVTNNYKNFQPIPRKAADVPTHPFKEDKAFIAKDILGSVVGGKAAKLVTDRIFKAGEKAAEEGSIVDDLDF